MSADQLKNISEAVNTYLKSTSAEDITAVTIAGILGQAGFVDQISNENRKGTIVILNRLRVVQQIKTGEKALSIEKTKLENTSLTQPSAAETLKEVSETIFALTKVIGFRAAFAFLFYDEKDTESLKNLLSFTAKQ